MKNIVETGAAVDTPVRKPDSKAAHIAKKVVMNATVTAVMAIAFAIPASAADASSFLSSAIGVLQTVLSLIGGGVAIWGIVNLLEGYGNDNPGSKSQGMKQLMAGIGIILVAVLGLPLLSGLMGTGSGS